jgi:asparagine synthase (glutamine-hydrolysing)
MCGILIAHNPSEERIKSIAHRGIEYYTHSDASGLTLCHHRLPIQTAIGDGWVQPVELSKDRYLLFNGEIFNYPPDFGSDTEYLVNLFSSFNFSSLEMFTALYEPHIKNWDGFWAICLVDMSKKEVICFTDPLGKKCLYYNDKGEICSEMKGLIDEDSFVDQAFMGGVRKWGYVSNESTPFENITKLKPNFIYKWNFSAPDFKQEYGPYFAFKAPIFQFDSEDGLLDWVWNKVELSTKNRLLSLDYPISILLSGGLDSSIIGGLLLKLGADVSWYTINNGPDNEYVAECEKYWGIKVNRLDYKMDANNPKFDKFLPELYFRWNESPVDMGSVVPQYLLFDAIKKGTNTRIVLSGDGADEMFGGYRRINEYDSQGSDVFHELTSYHLPRLDKMSMAHTLELRNPFLNLELIQLALQLPFDLRKNKEILKRAFKGLIPDSVIERKKHPLKNEKIVKDASQYRIDALNYFQQGYTEYLDSKIG